MVLRKHDLLPHSSQEITYIIVHLFLPIIEQEGRDDAIITMETVNVIGLTHLHTKALESM